MKIKSVFKSLAGRVEDLFGGSKASQADLDLIEQLDRSWSGKTRNGQPRHYRPGSRDGSWRCHPDQGASRAYFPTEHLPTGPRPSRGLNRVSSEPCSIHSLAEARPKQDSASSVHDDPAELVLSAPMDIYPSNYQLQALTGPTAPVPVGPEQRRAPSWHRRRAAAAAAVAAKKAAQAEKAARAAEAEAKRAAAAAPRKPSCLKQGGLSTALSREPSVRHGATAAGETHSGGRDSLDAAADAAVGSWGARKVTFRAQRSDSAHDANTRPSKPSSGVAVDAEALTAALEALSATDQVSTSSGGDYRGAGTGTSAGTSPGVIVADTSLAMEWPGSSEAVDMANMAPRPLQAAAEASSAPLAASELAAGDAPRRTRSLDYGATRNGEEDTEEELTAEEAAAAAAAAAEGSASSEWNAKFVKRWRAVKQRARLQALGMRSIWKLNSPASGEHHPPELLTNELPEGVPVSPAALAGTATAASLGECLAFSAGSQLRPPAPGGAAAGPRADPAINRDPSLATMLLGEVAEVC